MNFNEALKILNIEDYKERIFNSNSHGELFHLEQYFLFAEIFKDDPSWFREWFMAMVDWAQENWSRPESVFQHMDRLLKETIFDKIN